MATVVHVSGENEHIKLIKTVTAKEFKDERQKDVPFKSKDSLVRYWDWEDHKLLKMTRFISTELFIFYNYSYSDDTPTNSRQGDIVSLSKTCHRLYDVR